MGVCVCDINNRNCMFHLCTDCPGKLILSEYLQNLFVNNDFDLDDELYYKQWVSTDRTALVTYQSTISEFLEVLVDKLYELCHHHFIKEAQSSYLKEAKSSLDDKTCIILMDFAE
jgi:phenolic acid decarboxylase